MTYSQRLTQVERTIYDRIFESVFLMAWRHAEPHAVPIGDTSGRQPTAEEISNVAKYAAMMAGMAEIEARRVREQIASTKVNP